MEISSREFSSELVKIIQLIADSHFVALDLEFSGISSRRARGGRNRLSLQQVYEEVQEAAKLYQVLQVGLTIVEEDAQKGNYVDRSSILKCNTRTSTDRHALKLPSLETLNNVS